MKKELIGNELDQYLHDWSMEYGEPTKRRNGTDYGRFDDKDKLVDALTALIHALHVTYGYQDGEYAIVRRKTIELLSPKAYAKNPKAHETWERNVTSFWMVAYGAVFKTFKAAENTPKVERSAPAVEPAPKFEKKTEGKKYDVNPDGSVVIDRPLITDDIGEETETLTVIDEDMDLFEGLGEESE